ncbi:hypothetical protein Ancab_007911 [Ancistrocladus abbreviatus]
MEFDLENPLINFQHNNNSNNHDSTLPSLFLLESDHMVTQTYILSLNIPLRHETVSLISQVSRRFDPFLSYLAVNYLDRFFSSQGIPEQKPWVVRLLSIACVSLAAKMMKAEFSVSDVQCSEGFIFDTQTIERMELLILGALKWRMRSITPFSFLHYFISLFKLKDPPSRHALKARAVEIIFGAQNEIKLMEFKPSIVAASALVSASHELFPMQCPCFRKAISSCPYVNKEKLSSCCRVIQKMVMEGYESVFDVDGAASSSETPVNVLDHHWSSYISTTITTASTASEEMREPKRHKRLGGFCKNTTLQLSHIQRC